MSRSWQKYLSGVLLLLAGGTLIGWLYDHPAWGLLTAALVTLGWHVRQLLIFEDAIRRRRFERIPYGEGIWSQLFSQFRHLSQRSRAHKESYRRLLAEVRKSTNALPDGGIVLNGDHEVVLCNKAAKQLVGFKRRKDRGQRVDNILRDPAFIEYLKSGRWTEGIEIRSPVQEEHWLFCRLVPYGADQTLLLIRDVTEAKRMATMRREFAANASHELRSPLTVISGYLDSIADDEDIPGHWEKPLADMRTQATRMNHIVDELLELSRLEGAATVTENQIVNVPGLLAAARKSCADRAGIAAIEVDCRTDALLLGSNLEIESVISNLLSNAIRHTPAEGTITLCWRRHNDGATLDVTDNGEGIAAEYVPRITERFFRADPGRSRDDGGIGLGLAIVKHALGRHDAVLEIDSEPGRGSRFSCRFPAERVVSPDAALEPGEKSVIKA